MGLLNFLKRNRDEAAAEAQAGADELVSVALPKRSPTISLRGLFKSSNIDPEELSDLLIAADFGVDLADEIASEVQAKAKKSRTADSAEWRSLLAEELLARLTRADRGLRLDSGVLPYVVLVVGVNGAGKTTTIGKLAHWLQSGDWRVVLGAADTFRAAAVEQLATWAERSSCEIVLPTMSGQDPASVAYQTVSRAIESSADIAIIDTAGRLQNKRDLMDELSKVRRAIEKQTPVTEVLLVIDGSTGQNALAQARIFSEVAGVTGIVITKLDGSAKGGAVMAIERELDIPIKLVGLGEGIEDFAFFDPESYVRKLTAVEG
jgi:fused signal recognition particle receptor